MTNVEDTALAAVLSLLLTVNASFEDTYPETEIIADASNP